MEDIANYTQTVSENKKRHSHTCLWDQQNLYARFWQEHYRKWKLQDDFSHEDARGINNILANKIQQCWKG